MDFGVLGPLAIRRHGRAVPLTTPKQRALLILLVLDVGRTVSVDRLVDDLWSGDPPPHAVATLRSYVSHLRRALADPARPESVVLTRGNGYALSTEPDTVDAIRFEQLVQQGRRELDAGRSADAIARADAALSLWRGPALADVAHEAFAQGPIARLDELRLSAEEDRFEALLASGHAGDLIGALQAFVTANPLRERPRSQLMLALYRAGRAPEALASYRQFRGSLAEGLGMDPSPSLADLADRMIRQSPDLELSSPITIGTPVSQVLERAHADHARPRLVGRDAEQRELMQALDLLAEGRGKLLLVAGEPGIGKTALLQWLDQRATASGVPVHWGRCQRVEGVPPFWPWIQILRSITNGLDDPELSEAANGLAAPVTQIVDEIAARVGWRHPASGGDAAAARFALHEALIAFLQRTAPAGGSVLILDDVQLAGPPSLELLTQLAPQVVDTPLLVAASYRDLLAERPTALDAALAALAREPDVDVLTPAPLTRAHVAEVVADVTRVPPSQSLAATVHDRTEGNPFFVHQLARLLDDASGSRHDGRISTAIPLGARHVITRRLQLVSEVTRQLLDAAAVAGRDFDVRVVSAAAGMRMGDALDAADDAVAHGLIEDVGEPALSYRFSHALIRDTVYAMLTPARAAHLHGSVGDVLERGPRPPIEALAEHFWRAADVTEDDRPLRYLLDAADQALRVLAYELAEEQLRRALHLLSHRDGRSPADEPGERALRLRFLRLISSLHGWSAAAIEDVARWVLERGTEPAGGPAELVPVWWSLWSAAFTRGDVATARHLAERLLREAQDDQEPAKLAAAHLCVGYTAFFAGEDPHAQLRRLAAARAFADRADHELLAAVPEHLRVCIDVADALLRALTGTPGALDTAAGAVAFAAELDRPFAECYARLCAGAVGAIVGDAEFVDEAAEPGLRLAERHGLRYAASLATISQAWACAQRGEDPSSQARRISAAIDQLRAAGQRHGAVVWLLLLADVHALAGDEAAATQVIHAADALAAEMGEPVYARLIAQRRRRLAPSA